MDSLHLLEWQQDLKKIMRGNYPVVFWKRDKLN